MSNSPRFPRDSYNLLISEDVDIDFPIGQVNASVVDKRWKLTYWIRDLDGKMPFRVDPGTGWIYTTKKLDREKKAFYVLPYMASAGRKEKVMLIQTLFVDDESKNFCIIFKTSKNSIISRNWWENAIRLAGIKSVALKLQCNALTS